MLAFGINIISVQLAARVNNVAVVTEIIGTVLLAVLLFGLFVGHTKPVNHGFDILGQLRGRPVFATLPIVLLTVKAELGDIRKGLALGADGYITKPYSKNQLAEVIGRVLKQPAR